MGLDMRDQRHEVEDALMLKLDRRAPQPRLRPAIARLRRNPADLGADELHSIVMEFLAEPEARNFALKEAHRYDARRISDGADRFRQSRRQRP